MYMKNLEELLAQFPLIKIANECDNKKILEFYQTIAMTEGEDDIIYERSPNYFSFLEYRSSKSIVFIINEGNEIQGICAISFRQTIQNNIAKVIGYVGDLRIKSSKKYTFYWRKFANLFFEFSHNFPETDFCDFYYTALIDTNKYSTRNFLNKGLGEIEFKKITTYHMINYLFPVKIRPKTISKLKILRATKEDISVVKDFISLNTADQFIAYQEDEILRRLRNWKDFNTKNILIIKDHNESIVAITSIWDPASVKRIRFFNNSKIKNCLYNFISKITPLNLPSSNSILKILYLNQIIIKKDFNPPKNFLRQILKHVHYYEMKNQDYNFISYCDFSNNNFHKGLNFDIFLKIKMGIYEMKHTSRPSPEITSDEIAFEMSLV